MENLSKTANMLSTLTNIFSAIKNGSINQLQEVLLSLKEHERIEILHHRLKCGVELAMHTPLTFSIKSNQMTIAYFLLQNYNIDVNQKNDIDGAKPYEICPNETALWYCVDQDNLKLAEVLVRQYKADPDEHAESNLSPLEYACYTGNINIVTFLLKIKAKMHKVLWNGNCLNTCLMWAIANNKKDIVELLLQKDSNAVNQVTANKGSPLHMACYFGHSEIVSLLCHMGASFKIHDKFQLTPIETACVNCNEESFKVLLKHTEGSTEKLEPEFYVRIMELMGASLGIKYSSQLNRAKCYQYLRDAMKLRYPLKQSAILKKPLAPQLHYGYRLEHMSLEELKKLRDVTFLDVEKVAENVFEYEDFPLARESFIILERNLGPVHPFIAYKIAEFVYEYGEGIINEVSQLLLKKAVTVMLDIYQHEQHSLFVFLILIIHELFGLKVYETQDRFHNCYKDLKQVIYEAMTLHKNQVLWHKYIPVYNPMNQEANVNCKIIDLVIFALFQPVISIPQRSAAWKALKKLVTKFVRLSDNLLIQKENNTSILHRLYQNKWPERIRQDEFFTRITQLLLECEAKTDCNDVNNLTPLETLNASQHMNIEVKTKCIQMIANKDTGTKTQLLTVIKSHSLW